VFTPCSFKLEFHDADTETDTDILARILADTSDARFPEVIFMASSTTRRRSRDDPCEDVGEEVRVGVGVVECHLRAACRPSVPRGAATQRTASGVNEP